ncbi:MAG: peptidoglycan DD-metalloendopeptidase family protein [Chitinophagales bacterium]|nr:peptidoglycan DD-metalloendopeptidase family protein [Chitinophagales bacterium]
MKNLQFFLVVVTFFLPGHLPAQKDSIRLFCPLEEAVVVPPPKNAIKYDPPDLCIVLTSLPDSIVKSVANARVTNVEIDEEGKYGIVIFSKINNKDYYFWYTGLNKTIVSKNTLIKAGQAIGYIEPGGRVEMLMYQFETQLDPSKYLDCKNVLKNE